MKVKDKIENKIDDLFLEVEQMELELKIIVNSDSRDWVRAEVLLIGMNIIFNQMNTLRELY